VTLMSERTSSLWISLLEKAGILNQALPIVAYCISEQAAEPLRGAGWKKVVIANEPTLASLIQCVDNGSA
jgi:uroporphyrinogen-III synthase